MEYQFRIKYNEKNYMKNKPNIVTYLLLIVIAVLLIVIFTLYFNKQNSSNSSNNKSGSITSENNKKTNDYINNKDHIRGNKNAKIALIEYSDLECSFCKKFHPVLEDTIEYYGDKVMWVYRHFPLNFHVNAQKESEAAECAYEIGDNAIFWEYIDTIFERTKSNGTGFAINLLTPLAIELGLNADKFQECLNSDKYQEYVEGQIAMGKEAGVTGTPGTLIVNLENGENYLVSGSVSLSDLKIEIDKFLK